jgi:uncharacterized protein YceK
MRTFALALLLSILAGCASVRPTVEIAPGASPAEAEGDPWLKRPYTVAWVALAGAVVTLEVVALLDEGDGDSASAHVQYWLETQRWARPVLAAGLGLLAYHWLIGNYYGPRE